MSYGMVSVYMGRGLGWGSIFDVFREKRKMRNVKCNMQIVDLLEFIAKNGIF